MRENEKEGYVVMESEFIYCPRCGDSESIVETDYEEENDEGEYEINEEGRGCTKCGWEGDREELVSKGT